MYYFQCYNCLAIEEKICKNKGKLREYRANGSTCEGFNKNGFFEPDITINQKILRKYITFVDHIFKCSYDTPYSIKEFDFNMRGIWSSKSKRRALIDNKITIEKDGFIFIRLKDGTPYYRRQLTWEKNIK